MTEVQQFGAIPMISHEGRLWILVERERARQALR